MPAAAGARRAPLHRGLAWAVERPVLAIFVLALLARTVAAVVITAGWGGSLFLDDASYSRLAAQVADGRYGALSAYEQWLYDHTGTLLVPLTGLYEVLGTVKLAGQLEVALFGAATAALTTCLALELVSRRWALLAGAMVALLPSQILWSSLILKDAAVWAILCGIAVTLAIAGRSDGRRLAVLTAVSLALLALLGFLRLHTLEVALVALWISVAIHAVLGAPRPVLRVAVATLMVSCFPLLFGMGLFGATFVRDARLPVVQRALNAAGANSATIDPEVDEDATTVHPSAELSYLPKGVAVVALRPWPWEPSRGSVGLVLARLESLLWYPLLLLAAVGLTTVPARLRVLAFPLLAGGAILVMYALTEGNLGTAFRHRGELVWIVLLLATLGLERLWRRRRVSPPAPVASAHEQAAAQAPEPIPAQRP
jgi:hypothetical protein